MRIHEPARRAARIRRLALVAPAIVIIVVVAAAGGPAAGGEDDAAEKKAAGEKAAKEEREAAREEATARTEAAREKSLLDGKPMPKDWRLDTKMVPNDVTGQKAEQIVAKLLAPRSDSWADWRAPLEPLHHCGEPRLLPPRCVPPPPCHPAEPPHPYDLVGASGEPTAGPIYRGPCCPRTGSHDDGPLPRVHRVHDRLFDWFYMWK
jgi:hypothetical protein